MFCSNCGASIEDGSLFCARCGAPAAAPIQPAAPQQPFVPTAPIYAPIPSSPLRPALRHPFFYVTSALYLIYTVIALITNITQLPAAVASVRAIFGQFIPLLLSFGSSILLSVGLILLFTAGLRKDGAVPENGFTLIRIALILGLVNAAYSFFPFFGSIAATPAPLRNYYITKFILSVFIQLPLSLIVYIFAMKVNQTAIAMAKGKPTTISSGLSILIFIQAGLSIILEWITAARFASVVGIPVARYLGSALPMTILSAVIAICFGVLLLLIPQPKKNT